MVYVCNSELYHHGILGQIHGVRNGPPYPLDPEDHSASEKKAGWRKSLSDRMRDRKIQKRRKAALEKARLARKAKAEEKKRIAAEEEKKKKFEEEKQRVKEGGNPSEILKYKDQFTKDELLYARQKVEEEQKLASMASANKQSTWDKVDRAMQRIDQTRDWIDKGTKFYNSVAKIVNAALEEDLPIIGEGGGGGKKKDKKKD